MGIAQTFIDFIKILYTENTSTITNNGYFSKPIHIQRGLRQGYPLSLPLSSADSGLVKSVEMTNFLQ